MPPSLDDYLPKTRFQLPGGAAFQIGTMWDDETCRQLVLFRFYDAGSEVSSVEFAVSAVSADAVIKVLQDSANQARYINGEATFTYPPPIRDVRTPGPKKKRQSPKPKAAKND